jgi:hypothetical protein
MIDREKYKTELEVAEERLSHLLARRQRMDSQIARLRLDISALAQLCGQPVMTMDRLGMGKNLGLSDACREVLRANEPNLLTPAEVVEGLGIIGFPIDGQTNILASVATTLRRMARSGELKLERTAEGNRGFRFTPAPIA